MDKRLRALAALGYVPLYVALDWLSYIQPVLKLGITPWSPQAGLTVAFLLWAGPRWAPCTALAAFLAEVLVRHAPAGLPLLACASAWIALCYAGLCLLLGIARVQAVMHGLAAAVRFAAAVLLAAVAAAIGYVACFVLAGSLPLSAAVGSAVRYAIGDVNGVLMLTPLLVVLPGWRAALSALRAGWRQALAQALVIVLFVWLLFGLDMTDRLRFFYPLFVPVIWVAVRWGAMGALLASLTCQVGIVVAMRDATVGAPLVDLQILMLTLVLTGLLLGAVVAEREQARAEARERDRQLARAMRFAVAGELASALAHELKQPITALVSYLHASQIMSPASGAVDPRLSDTLGKATHEALRASDVLRQLRDFYQGAVPGSGPTGLADCCALVIGLLEARIRAQGVRLHLQLPGELPPVAVDRTQLEMVLHNLLSNALDALATQRHGPRELLVAASVADGRVSLHVQDSGPGVAADAADKLFEPFNTTKADGMGLGLAISRNLVRAQGGELAWRPARPGELGGASFELQLPACTGVIA